MHRIQRGFRLLGRSWEVLRADKELIGLAFVSLFLSFVVAAAAAGLLWLLEGDLSGVEEANSMLLVTVGVVTAFGLTLIGVFTTAAIVGCATIRLKGGDPTLADGLGLASRHLPKLIGWSLVTVTVGLVLRAVRERAGVLGNVVGWIAEAAWEVLTFLTIPVMLYEDAGPIASIKRSAALFRQRWGEQLTGDAAIGLALFLVALPVLLVAAALAAALPILGIVVGVVAIVLLISIGSALSGIFRAALYQYAVEADALAPFTTDDLAGSFVPKRR